MSCSSCYCNLFFKNCGHSIGLTFPKNLMPDIVKSFYLGKYVIITGLGNVWLSEFVIAAHRICY